MTASTRTRIGVVQFSPKHGDVEANFAKARELIASIEPGSLDLLCFPEMAFTGYTFSADTIRPYLEDADTGPTAAFLSSLSRNLRTHVAAGFPLALAPSESRTPRLADPSAPSDDIYGRHLDANPVGANAALLLRPDGVLAALHRKLNLFRLDVPWAQAGEKFTTVDLGPPLGRVTLAICMDLNPALDAAHESVFEVAEHCVREGTTLLVLLNAWLDSREDTDTHEDWCTLQYWAYRLHPLCAEREGAPEETLVVICNRTGSEDGLTFAGSSALLRCKRGAGRAQILGVMGRDEEGVHVWTVCQQHTRTDLD
ncbi:carbon-nitrogen hydrolase [Vararia minispora EC-137]|uniref:Carbon-nitrogen hydrolase n=1 Tax=Vararia minispora EC-137 TaxID=1314806 RepID=A0ACB8QLP9_9AGAM|nr:carbon-nitrogen hydrolase [Vararia minispora EC-137]